MAASMNFRPGGAEDDFDDDDGFVLDFENENTPAHDSSWASSERGDTVSSGRGGFGAPPSKKRGSVTSVKKAAPKEERPRLISKTKNVSVGDFKEATQRGNTEMVEKYIKEGFDVNTILQGGWTGLMYAANAACPAVVSLLLENGADPKYHKDMYTVLMAACGSTEIKEEKVLQVVAMLLGKGAEANTSDRYHLSPLMYAAREGRCSVIQKLVDAGANVNKQDSRGWTALSWAVSKNHKQAVRTLLACKAEPLKKHCDNQTALDLARNSNLEEIVQMFGGSRKTSDSTLLGDSGQPSVTMTNSAPQANLPPAESGDFDSSTDLKYGMRYGELELFLSGLDLSKLISEFQKQQVDFATFLRMTEEDLVKMGISQIGVRKKILDGIQSVHKKEWEKSSLLPVQYNRHVSCPEAIAMVANISKHAKYINSTIGFIGDQIKRYPTIVQQTTDGVGPKQLHQHTEDALGNVQTLKAELESLKVQLDQITKGKNFDPPDLLTSASVLQPKRSRGRTFGLLLSGTVIVCVLWKRQFIWDKFINLVSGND